MVQTLYQWFSGLIFLLGIFIFEHHLILLFLPMVHLIWLLLLFLHCSHQTFRMFGDIHSTTQRSPDYEHDNEMSYLDSFEHSLSSSGKVCFSESFCDFFISILFFYNISSIVLFNIWWFLPFFSLRRTCHPGGRDILMMHCLSFSEKRLLLITIFLESERFFSYSFVTFFFAFFCFVCYTFFFTFCLFSRLLNRSRVTSPIFAKNMMCRWRAKGRRKMQ